MKIILNGAAGRMGRMLREEAANAPDVEIVAGVDVAGGQYASLDEFHGPADCVVDFSNHAGTGALTAYCARRGLPAVIATTGQTEPELAQIRQAAQQVPIFFSANMSVGVALLADLARRAAAAFPGPVDIEIIERHHNQKLDVPSGTALMLSRSIREARPEMRDLVGRHENGKRSPDEIGIHSLRYGSEVGTHEIILSNGAETLTLKHEAQSRALFARGAIAAAAFICKKSPGLYSMKDLLGEGD